MASNGAYRNSGSHRGSFKVDRPPHAASNLRTSSFKARPSIRRSTSASFGSNANKDADGGMRLCILVLVLKILL